MNQMVCTVLLWGLIAVSVSAQDAIFEVSLDRDTILAGNYLTVTYRVENLAGRFEASPFEGLQVVSGPNTSTSMTIINGKVSQEATYSYMLQCNDIGDFFVPPGYLIAGDDTYETEPIPVVVLPNPDGIVQPVPGGGPVLGISTLPKRASRSRAAKSKPRRPLKKI